MSQHARVSSRSAILCAALAVFLLAGSARAAAEFTQKALEGQWTGTVTSSGQTFPFTLQIDTDGNVQGYLGPNPLLDPVSGRLIVISRAGAIFGTLAFSSLGGTVASTTGRNPHEVPEYPPQDPADREIFRVLIVTPGTPPEPNCIKGTFVGGTLRVHLNISGGTDIRGGLPPQPPITPVAADKPELVGSVPSLPSGLIVAGTPFTISTTITNLGQITAPEFFVSFFNDQKSPIGSSGGAAVTQLVRGGLAFGATTIMATNLTYSEPGDYTLAILVDSEKHVGEANEGNNFVYVPIRVLARGSDLAIKSINTVEPNRGFNAQFTVTLENRGTTATGAFRVGFFGNRFSAPRLTDTPDQSQALATLGAQGVTTVTFTLPNQNISRGGRAWFVVDHQNTVAEDRENNNIDTATWGVANGPVAITSALSASAAAVTVGQPVTFTLGASDPDGDPLGYFWEFGDGVSEQANATASHVYTAAGIFTAKVTVADGPFSSGTATTSVEVFDAEIIDLGTASLSAKKGNVFFSVPVPVGFTGKARPKAVILSGNPGTKARLANTRFKAKAPGTGVFRFVVEYSTKKPQQSKKVVYQYTVTQ